MVIHKTDSQRYELQIGDIRSKQVQRFNYMGSVQTDEEKFDSNV